jgi:hypothetical protein
VAKPTTGAPVLLRWSEHVPATDVQDPLGLALRGSARLGSSLLYCITSITPRARYFSFLPWSIFDHQLRERGKPHALGLHDGIVLREQALTLGCIAHHDGHPYPGGALVGTRGAQRWYRENRKTVNLRKVRFAKNPALLAYFNSLVNLGFFVTQTEVPDSEEAREDEDLTFDDIELSELGLRLSKSYDSAVNRLSATREIASVSRVSAVTHLAEFGKKGGLCELVHDTAPDRNLLRQVFFDQVGIKGQSHHMRKQSLLLILELCRLLSSMGVPLDETAFADAVYFGTARDKTVHRTLTLPMALREIALRWRMFYFHHYMSVALEGAFAWIVSQLELRALAGGKIDDLIDRLDERSVHRDVSKLFGIKLTTKFAGSSPADLFRGNGVVASALDDRASVGLDSAVSTMTPLAENSLEEMIRGNKYLTGPMGLAVPLVLLAITLGRFRRWEGSKFGGWLANHVTDPYLDLLPPLVANGLVQRFGNWWTCPWRELARHIVSRYVIRQHLTMSYEKSSAGDRCLLQDDGQRIVATGVFDKVGMGNVRFHSARQVLEDLALIEPNTGGIHRLTADGARLLKQELANVTTNEIH